MRAYLTHLCGVLMCRITILLSLFFSSMSVFAACNEQSHCYQLIQKKYTIYRDYRYTLEIKKKVLINDAKSIKEAFQDNVAFSPNEEKVRLDTAFVLHQNKKKEYINKNLVHTQNLSSSQDTPGYSSDLVTTFLFPKITTGDTLQSQWHINHFGISPLGINITSEMETQEQIDEELILIDMPKQMKMHWQKRGKVSYKESIKGNRRIVIVRINHTQSQPILPLSVSRKDTTPIFMATTLPSWQTIGKIYHDNAYDKAKVTPKVSALAQKIVGDKKGLDAARAIYDWVAGNIKYVFLPLNANAGFVPNYANDIIENGFGDCKDHVTLMQSLLSAVGIKSEPVLISWDNSFEPFPLWNPGEFNHIIIYLPAYDLYANPTSEASPFSKLDLFLSGKFVVHAGVKPQLKHTPKNIAQDNRYDLKTNIILSSDGSLLADGTIKVTGLADSTIRKLMSSSKSELDTLSRELLSDESEGGSGEIIPQTSSLAKIAKIAFHWQSPNAIEAKDLIYFKIPKGIDFKSLSYLNTLLQADQQASTVLGASTLSWTYHITIPGDYHIASIPRDRTISNERGAYRVHYQQKDNVIIVHRELVSSNDLYSPKEYEAFKSILHQARFDDASTIVLKKSHS
jgi:Domain of Unknown Function with PDB structure (DUF3857)/Domain of Unknown Function with PDB structure (DUF3858)/Transglutaminase-like superfamily